MAIGFNDLLPKQLVLPNRVNHSGSFMVALAARGVQNPHHGRSSGSPTKGLQSALRLVLKNLLGRELLAVWGPCVRSGMKVDQANGRLISEDKLLGHAMQQCNSQISAENTNKL